MKILHLVAGDLSGGAARGAYWLHLAQRALGIDSVLMISGQKDVADPSVVSCSGFHAQRLKKFFWDQLAARRLRAYPHRKPWIFNLGLSGFDITGTTQYREADLIHLHWITNMVNLRTLHKLDKPVVWTLRDMWPLTGGCHYAMDCERYRVGCGQCPQLASQREHDLSRRVAEKKKRSLPRNLRVVGISHWLSQCAQQSRVFGETAVQTITNNIDTEQFFPVDQAVARMALKLPANRKIILIGAQQLSDFYKGFDLFVAALRRLDNQDLHVLTFGRASSQELDAMGVDYTQLGFLSDAVSLRLAYSAADVFVAPSRMDAFGKTLGEAMACGTPAVCFDATGPKDVVVHQKTGYKAEPFSPESLAEGMQWVLNRPAAEREALRQQASEHARNTFAPALIAAQYRKLYQQMLEPNAAL